MNVDDEVELGRILVQTDILVNRGIGTFQIFIIMAVPTGPVGRVSTGPLFARKVMNIQ